MGYIGPSVCLADLITRPKNSLVNQSFDPEFHHLLQLGGSGFASWDKTSLDPARPLVYRSCKPAFYDDNLQALCSKLKTDNMLAHIRATGYNHKGTICDENCHPFLYPNFRLALAHNGGLPGWREMLADILAQCKPEVVRHLTGSTDTEPLYCLLMSQFEDPTADLTSQEILQGLSRFMAAIRELKTKHKNMLPAKLKLFLADGNDLVVANIGLGYDLAEEIPGDWDILRQHAVGTREFTLAGVMEPVWYLPGHGYSVRDGSYGLEEVTEEAPSSLLISSEPSTSDTSDWRRIPFGHVAVLRGGDTCSVVVERLEF